MNEEALFSQIGFIIEIDKLKYIERKTKLFNSNRKENVSEHSWHLALMALILNGYSNVEINLLVVIKMLLIHDLVEIDAGDTFLYAKYSEKQKFAKEEESAQRLFNMLPKKQAKDLYETWIEFEKGQSAESKFARALDNLQPVLQNNSNNGGTWNEFQVNFPTVMDKKIVIKEGSRKLWDFTKTILEKCVDKGVLAK